MSVIHPITIISVIDSFDKEDEQDESNAAVTNKCVLMNHSQGGSNINLKVYSYRFAVNLRIIDILETFITVISIPYSKVIQCFVP